MGRDHRRHLAWLGLRCRCGCAAWKNPAKWFNIDRGIQAVTLMFPVCTTLSRLSLYQSTSLFMLQPKIMFHECSCPCACASILLQLMPPQRIFSSSQSQTNKEHPLRNPEMENPEMENRGIEKARTPLPKPTRGSLGEGKLTTCAVTTFLRLAKISQKITASCLGRCLQAKLST